MDKSHSEKAELAALLFRDGILSVDAEDRLRELNTVRKDVAYGEPGPELEHMDLEELAIELEQILDEVERIIDAAEEIG